MPDPVHPAAARGYDAAADTYVAGRPDYPAGLTGWLRNALGLAPGRTVVDLGAGTGKAVPRLRETGAAVRAVEPVAAMRARLAAAHPDIGVEAGTAAAMPFADGAIDAVVCAQSFHWFATVEALAEIRRVVRPGGALGLIWNVRDERVDWVAELSAIIAPYEGETPRHHSGQWRTLFPAPGFGALQETVLPHAGHAGSAERVVLDRTLSVSFIAALPEAERRGVADAVRGLIARTPALRQELVVFPYITRAYACRRDG